MNGKLTVRKSNGSGPRRFGRVLRVVRVLSVSGVWRVLKFRGWQTAGLDAHKTPLMWPWDACWRRMPGERQTGPSEKAMDLARDALAEF